MKKVSAYEFKLLSILTTLFLLLLVANLYLAQRSEVHLRMVDAVSEKAAS